MKMLKHLDLCSGIGGFAVGFSMAKLSEPIAFCDTDKFCQKVLAKNFPGIPIYDDVKEIADDPTRFISERPDILTSGYPCQPFSTSGKRGGTEDPRHIFPYLHKLIEQIRPTYCVFEIVYGLLSLGLDEVLFAMESINYHTRTFVFPSSSIGAWHKRDRLWIVCKSLCDTQHNGSSSTKIRGSNEEDARWSQKGEIQTKQFEGTSGRENHSTLADSECLGWFERSEEQEEFNREGTSDKLDFSSEGCRTSRSGSHVADTKSEGLQGWSINSTISNGGEKESQLGNESSRVYTDEGIWFAEPNVGRVAHGIPKRVDRLKGLGNAIVPQIAMQIGLAIKSELS